jgi:hypothetical protein
MAMDEPEHLTPRRTRIVMSTDEATPTRLEDEPQAVIRLSLGQAEQLRSIEEQAEQAVARAGAQD